MVTAAVSGIARAEEPAGQPDKVGNIPLTEQTYQRLIEAAKARGLNELAEKLQSQDANVRREAARTLIGQLREQGRGGPGGGPGERPNLQGMGPGGPPGEGGDPRDMMRRMGGMGMMAPPVVISTDKYLFIVRGDIVYQLDIDTLEILKQTQLPPPQGMMRPFGPPPEGAPGARPEKQGEKQQ